MKAQKLTLLTLIASIALFGSCRKEITPINQEEQATCANPPAPPTAPPVITYCGSTTVSLVADGINVGTVTVGNDANNLYVTYNLTNGYKVSKTRVYAGTLAGLPKTYSGNANSSAYPYRTTHSPYVTTFTYTIPLSSLPSEGGCNVVSAFSEVVKTNYWGWVTFDEIGWAAGTPVNSNPGCGNGGTYMNWCNASCTVEIPPEK